jgi:hypothetical protein
MQPLGLAVIIAIPQLSIARHRFDIRTPKRQTRNMETLPPAMPSDGWFHVLATMALLVELDGVFRCCPEF